MDNNSTVPNKFPSVVDATDYRIALVGEAPGIDEVAAREPFVGASGRLLNALLSRNSILRSACFVGNVCQHRPLGNDIEAFDWSGNEIQSGLTQLAIDLAEFRPNLCVLLGGTALKAFHHETDPSIMAWRGSLFNGHVMATHCKCIASYHPAAALRDESMIPYLLFDLKRAREEGVTPELVLPSRHFDLSLSASETIARLDTLRSGFEVSVDIEGTVNGIPCISFTDDPFTGFIVGFAGSYNSSRWSVDEEVEVWRAVKRVLEDSKRPKVLQNSLYDRFVLAYSFNILIRNVKYDTMLMHWELYSEMKKSLGVQASIYTREPYYKSDRKSNDLRTFFEYCCKDSAVTLEIQRKLVGTLRNADLAHCQFNHALLNPLLYMELRGIRYDEKGANDKRIALTDEIRIVQAKVDSIAGTPLNVKSTVQKKRFLYTTLGLPEQHKRGTGAVTTNDEALLKLWKQTSHPGVFLLLQTVRKRTHLSMLGISADNDGRIRCAYNVVGSETGRVTCYTSPTGSGYNLQTIPEDDRGLFLADARHDLCQVDLSGADNWTVAAHSARLGDSNMLKDLLAGIKPAKVLVLMFRGTQLPTDRAELAKLCDTIPKTDPLYFGAKCCCHGSNYGMGAMLLSNTIFIQSDGEVTLSKTHCEKLQHAYFQRYPGILSWQRWCQEQVRTKRAITSASGHTRRFFGNPQSHDTFKQAYADEPQQNTTYATNRSVLTLWNDPRNRVVSVHRSGVTVGDSSVLEWGESLPISRTLRPGSLLVEPLHQVHDAFICQWPTIWRDYCRSLVRSYTAQTMTIAGQQITIPGEGHYGPSWGDQPHDL